MASADKLELVDLYVCVKCKYKEKIREGEGKPRKCPKCGGMMAKTVSLA